METNKVSFLKRKYLINPKVQLHFTAFFLVTMALTVGGLYYVVLESFRGLDSFCSSVADLQDRKRCAGMLFTFDRQISLAFFVDFILGVIALSIGGILITHRVVGPFYRFMQILKQLNQGDRPAEFRIRRDDYFKEMEALLNEFLRKQGERQP